MFTEVYPQNTMDILLVIMIGVGSVGLVGLKPFQKIVEVYYLLLDRIRFIQNDPANPES